MTPFGKRLGRTVAGYPDRVAVSDHSGRSLTYRQLYAAATAVRRRLAEASARHALVAVHNDVELVVALTGALLAGVAFVPLELRYSPGYLSGIAARLPDAVMLCGKDTATAAAAIAAREQIVVSGDPVAPVAVEDGDERAAVPGYVLFTSGSTGTPKGVRVSQHALLGYLDWIAGYAPATKRGALAHGSIMFDFSLPALLAPLLWGGQVRLVPDEQAMVERLALPEPAGLLRLTPSHILALHEFFGPHQPMAADVVVAGGEVLTWSHVRTLRSVLRSGTPIWNQYGPTEAVVGVSAHRVAESGELTGGVPIGVSRTGTRLSVVDDQLRPVPTGAVGELVISGGIADGYLDPVAGPDPFVDHPEWGRAYRTGDFGFLGADGLLRFSGRRDGQVKIRGHRVELGTVEAVLSSVAGVADVVAYLEPLGSNGSRLAAGVVPGPGLDHRRLAADLARVAADRLPDYARPAVVRYGTALPRNVTGKRDYPAMAALPVLGADDRDTGDGPEAGLANQLSRIFSDVLGVSMAVGDNFFTVGGDSITLLRVIARARAAGLVFAIADVHAAPTAHELAGRVNRLVAQEAGR